MVNIVMNELQNDNVNIIVPSLNKIYVYMREAGMGTRKEKALSFFRVGGHAAILRLMKQHSSSEDIQTQAVAILVCMTMSKDVEIRKGLLMMKGVDALCEILRKFPLHSSIQCNGIGALCNLTIGCASTAEHIVTKLGAVSLVVGAMSQFPCDGVLVQNCCKLLWSLCDSCKDRRNVLDAIRNAKAMSAVAAALENHGERQNLQEYGKGALKALLA